MDRRKAIASMAAGALATVGGTYYWKRRWRYIVVHHSAGNFGTIQFLQRVHNERQSNDPIKAIPYHYVIGNGNGLGLGEVAHDWRQEIGLWGAHVTAKNLYKNFAGIGICLIGNFDKAPVPEQQYRSLVQLTKSLMTEYAITATNISGHGHVAGEQTNCPGKYFPMSRFLAEILRG